nr:transcriptional regulator [Propionibacterium sp.]
MTLGTVEQRNRLAALVARVLDSEADGLLTLSGDIKETASIDFKEEAGRRRGPDLEPGLPENQEAATKLADEVACLANSPGGGALILGIEDKSGQVLGTELDRDWLRHRIYRAVDVAPDIVEHRVAGQRVLVLYVAEAKEPIEDTSGRIRWRVGDTCSPVDRSEWWQHRSRSLALDPMAAPTTATDSDITPGAHSLVRRFVTPDASASDREVLKQIGAVRSDGHLTQAGKLLLTPAGRPLIELTVLDVHGGEVKSRVEPPGYLSLLEQLDSIETSLDLVNRITARVEAFSAQPLREVPRPAVREAVLNGLIHRDWNRSEPTEVRWIQFDSTLIVRSPGGFQGGVTEQTVLSNRYARYPALADLFRALHLVEKQGLGVDRMYQIMITMGHRPPTIREQAGPSVTCELVGGEPVLPILALVRGIRPIERQRDARIAILLDQLLHRPWLSLDAAAAALQSDRRSAETAIRAAYQSSYGDEPLIRPYKGEWLLGGAVWRSALRSKDEPGSTYLAHATTDATALSRVAMDWLAEHDAVTTGDLMELTGISRGTAQRVLMDLEGTELKRVGAGRATRFVRRATHH